MELLGIPVVTGMSSIDLMESAHPLYVGRNGGTGNRPGNFAVQTCDVLFSIGSRQSFLQTGFAYEKWAAHAYTILNDIHMLEEAGCSRAHPWFADEKESSWREKCRHWREKYPVVTEEKYKEPEPGRTNIYAFYDSLSKVLPEGEQILVSVGTSRVAGSQAIYLKKGQRFYTNAVTASMGYGLPAAI